ncbi:hypothetical protein Cni_G12446 [Canna indica]|uniref:non-specific serine/threonine protein kinase n=1 Tax=Canna indica TaxID=4628 RepID=A0AAQ3Q912_9LILI|nr:hypothetical protein Cni_G12446 [Canna indica]
MRGSSPDGYASTTIIGLSAKGIRDIRPAFERIITTMQTLYQKCKLVHGDLSEYNTLYFEGHLYIIDVSQSVDLDHPCALEFLKEDCMHVSVNFFRKNGVAVMTVKELFDFVIDASIADEDVDDYLEKIQQKVLERGEVVNQEDDIAPTVFVQTLDYIKKCEEDLIQMAMIQRPSLAYQLKAEEIYDQPLQGFINTRSESNQQEISRTADQVPNLLVDQQTENSQQGTAEVETVDESTTDSEDDSSSFESEHEMGPDEKRAARKEHKKRVKEEKREARKNKKFSKAEKKR